MRSNLLKCSLCTVIILLLLTSQESRAQQERQRLVVANGGMHAWKDAATYAREHDKNVLDRSLFFTPMFGSVYKEKFEVLISKLPPGSIRGVVIHNHGCGGQGPQDTATSQFYSQNGFAVVAPEFVTREGNKTGCPGGSEEEALKMSAERFREGIYQARNPARLAARASEVMYIVSWLKTLTSLPIILSGHSEGCRTIYSIHLPMNETQVAGGACIKQGLQTSMQHTWRWNAMFPMWQSLEEFDPWVVFPEGTTAKEVTFEREFKVNPNNLTVVIVPGKTHAALNQEAERASLREWLNKRTSVTHIRGQNGFNYENTLSEIQEKLRKRIQN